MVNLVGYCVEKGQRILVYEFMSNGSLAEILYGKFVDKLPPWYLISSIYSLLQVSDFSYSIVFLGDNQQPLSWDSRVRIAQDVAVGIEYLHEGVC